MTSIVYIPSAQCDRLLVTGALETTGRDFMMRNTVSGTLGDLRGHVPDIAFISSDQFDRWQSVAGRSQKKVPVIIIGSKARFDRLIKKHPNANTIAYLDPSDTKGDGLLIAIQSYVMQADVLASRRESRGVALKLPVNTLT